MILSTMKCYHQLSPQQSGVGSLSQHVKFIGGGAFLKSLDEAESQFEDLLGFFHDEKPASKRFI